jgi:hypothetical protein
LANFIGFASQPARLQGYFSRVIRSTSWGINASVEIG